MPGPAIRLAAELKSKGPQRHRSLTRRARAPTGADQAQTALCSSADSATARPHRSPIAAEERIDPVVLRRPGCPLAATNVCPQRLPSAYQLSRGFPLKPHLEWPGPTEREPRSHCFDVSHQVRARAAKRARHRRGHIFCPRRMEADAARWGQLVIRHLPGMSARSADLAARELALVGGQSLGAASRRA